MKEEITMWSDTVGGITATCLYDTEDERYIVSCSMGDLSLETNWIRMGYEPRFGMDEVDTIRSRREAEKLAKELENEQ